MPKPGVSRLTWRDRLHDLLPSMFQRRLLILALAFVLVVSALGGQLFRLTVVQGQQWRERAESVLVQRRLVPTARGRILDRRMRVLAMDRPSYDVAVDYKLISGRWAFEQAYRSARSANRAAWAELDRTERETLIAPFQREHDQRVERFWETLCAVAGSDRPELEERRTAVIQRVQQVASDVWLRRMQQRSEALDEAVELSDVAQPISEHRAAHPLLVNVPTENLLEVRRRIELPPEGEADLWSLVSVAPSKERQYPLESMTILFDRSRLPSVLRRDEPLEVTVEGVATHVVGAMRNVWAEDAARRPFKRRQETQQELIDLGGYLPGDRVGAWGVEESQEDRLRGLRGQVLEHLDTLANERREPRAGEDVILTLDVRLQARIHAAMDPAVGLMKVQPWHARELTQPVGTPLNGAAVVIDVAQGHVLAAVSVPTFSLRRLGQDAESILGDDINQPYINRPIAMPYQPGSTVKPIVLVSAVTDRKIAPGATVTCEGHLEPEHPDRYRCWIYKGFNTTHGPLAGPEAIARSCNIFFYTMGRRLGAPRLVHWYDRFGVGHPLGCGLLGEVGGDLPDLRQANHPSAPGFTVYDATFMGIGQGPIRWTCLQAASAYAAIARGGYFVSPTFIMPAGRSDVQQTSYDLDLDPRGVDMAMKGLELAVNERFGTSHHLSQLGGELIFNIEGVKVYGKSGTADAAPHRVDSDGDGRITSRDRIVKDGDHAWFVGLVQRSGSPRPDFAIAVIVEFAGSGGAAAGPITNQILHALRDEGYL